MIIVEHLTRRYGATTAVDDLSFAVKAGVVTGFLGPNGAGKSTTMRMILGLDTPTAGNAMLNGRSLHKHRARSERSERCSTPRPRTRSGRLGTTSAPSP